MADRTAFNAAFGNISAFDTDDGLLLVDTGNQIFAGDQPRAPAELEHRAASARWCSPTATSTTSSAWARSRRRRPRSGWAAPHVVAHELLPARFERYVLTAGYNGVINQRQFQFAAPYWPTEYR